MVSILVLLSGNVFGFELLEEAFEESEDYVAWEVDDDEEGTIEGILSNVASFMLTATAVIAVPAVLIWGVMFILSLGDESKMKNAKTMLFYIWLGIFIALASYAIIQLVISAVGTMDNI